MAELRNRVRVEKDFADRLADLSDYERDIIRPYLGNPPDPRNIPQQVWDHIEAERKAALLVILMGVFANSARQHGYAGEEAQQAAQEWADERAEETASSYVKTSRRVMDAKYKAGTEEGAADVKPRADAAIDEDLAETFGPVRDSRMAINETTAAAHAGSEAAAEAIFGKSDGDVWRISGDNTCPVCEDLDGTTRDEWEVEFPDGPPSPHVGCNCWIDYENAGAIA